MADPITMTMTRACINGQMDFARACNDGPYSGTGTTIPPIVVPIPDPVLDDYIPPGMRIIFMSDGLSCKGSMLSGVQTADYMGLSGVPELFTGTDLITRPFYGSNAADYFHHEFYSNPTRQNTAYFRVPVTIDDTFDPITKGFTFIEFSTNFCFSGNFANPWADFWDTLNFIQEPATGSSGAATYADATRCVGIFGQDGTGGHPGFFHYTPAGIVSTSATNIYSSAWVADNPGSAFIDYGPKAMAFVVTRDPDLPQVSRNTVYYANEVNQTVRSLLTFNETAATPSTPAVGQFYATWHTHDSNAVIQAGGFDGYGKGVYLLLEGCMDSSEVTAFIGALFAQLRMEGAL